MDTELLDHEAESGKHGNTSVLDLGVLEPLDTIRTGIFQNCGSQRRALVSSLDTDTESLIDGGAQSSCRLLDRKRGESRSRGDEGESNDGFHLGGIL